MFKFELGTIAKDFVTGFEGMILGRTQYLTGCIQYGICPQRLKQDEAFPDWVWLDESRLRTIEIEQIPQYTEELNGGPSPAAPECN